MTVVQPDGSTISVKYPEPRHLIRLPIDLETATPEQQRRIHFIRLVVSTALFLADKLLYDLMCLSVQEIFRLRTRKFLFSAVI